MRGNGNIEQRQKSVQANKAKKPHIMEKEP